MFDFRYHALSLVAVFLALAIGILLGVTIGDSLVARGELALQSSLRRDVMDARRAEREVTRRLEGSELILESAFTRLVGGSLSGKRVALVALGELSGELEAPVTEAVEAAGGEIDSVSSVPMPPDWEDVAVALEPGGTRSGEDAERAARDLDQIARGGRRLGRSLVRGGAVAARVAEALPGRFRGDYEGADAVVVLRLPADGAEEPEGERGAAAREREARQALQEGVVTGLAAVEVPVVGVETLSTEPSQVPFYTDQDISSVDNVDVPGGQLALILVLGGADGADGAFGFKRSAQQAIPDLPSRAESE